MIFRFHLVFLSFFLGLFNILCGQLKLIDSGAIESWNYLDKSDIDKNGKYLFYTIKNIPLGKHTLIIQNTTGEWKKEIVDATEARFIGNNRQVMYRIRDTLFLITLGSEFKINLPGVKRFLLSQSQSQYLLAYQLLNSPNTLLLRDLESNAEEIFSDVTTFSFNKSGTVLLLETQRKEKGDNIRSLKWVDGSQQKSKNYLGN